MTTHEQNQKAIKDGQQGGAAQKNQNAQLGIRGEEALTEPTGVIDENQDPPATNPEQRSTPGGKGTQDGSQNQKR